MSNFLMVLILAVGGKHSERYVRLNIVKNPAKVSIGQFTNRKIKEFCSVIITFEKCCPLSLRPEL